MKKSVASCIVIGITVTLVVTVLATIFMHPLFAAAEKHRQKSSEESYSYISILSVFLFVMFAYNLCSGSLGAIGNSFMPLVFLIISSLVNIVLDLAAYPFFRHGCSRCCNCNRDCAGNFRRALPDLYCYQSKNSASGKTSF
ncbi:MAG: MATE family efflux transporter [Fusicatenibacter saccharivorans]